MVPMFLHWIDCSSIGVVAIVVPPLESLLMETRYYSWMNIDIDIHDTIVVMCYISRRDDNGMSCRWILCWNDIDQF